MVSLGQHLDDRQRRGSVIHPAAVIANRADGDVDVMIRQTQKTVRASRGNTGGSFTPGQLVQVSRTDASGVTSNTGWVIIGPAPSAMRGSSKSSPLSGISRRTAAAVTSIVPNPVPIVAGTVVTVLLYGVFDDTTLITYSSADLTDDVAPVITSTQVTLHVRADVLSPIEEVDLLLDGVVAAPRLFQVDAAPVSAAFSWLPALIHSGDLVTFADESTGAPTGWGWDFDDGGNSALQNPAHTFAAGDFNVALTVAGHGGPSSISHALHVAAPPMISTLAGLAGSAGDSDGTGSAARFNDPSHTAVDGSGNVFVADSSNHTIRKITPAGVVTTLAGLAGSAGSADGTGSAARFNSPYGLAIDGAGNLYVGDSGNHTIRKVTSAGVVTTLAGLAGSFGSTDGTGSAARFKVPTGVTVDGSGNVYVADSNNHTIRKVTPAGVVTTLAGAAGVAGETDGTGSAARFNRPDGVAVDSGGNVYVSDALGFTIRKVTSAGVVTTIAGLAGSFGSTDGTGSAARFFFPRQVAITPGGDIIVAGANSQTIRKVTPAGVVTTIAGLADTSGSSDGSPSVARFFVPFGVCVDGAGTVYICDSGNNTIRVGINL